MDDFADFSDQNCVYHMMTLTVCVLQSSLWITYGVKQKEAAVVSSFKVIPHRWKLLMNLLKTFPACSLNPIFFMPVLVLITRVIGPHYILQ